ncbi:MAG: ankyrin repeat domain-containing protein [Parachlamydia sp.]|nr:ankyrin repeat domain-containing protein [Parachlamydia sp.]
MMPNLPLSSNAKSGSFGANRSVPQPPLFNEDQRKRIEATLDAMCPKPIALNDIPLYNRQSIQKLPTVADDPTFLRNINHSHKELYQAVLGGNIEEVRKCLSDGARADVRIGKTGETAIHVSLGNPDILAVLLENGTDPEVRDFNDYTPLHGLVSGDTQDTLRVISCIKLLLAAGASVNASCAESRNTPLHLIMIQEESASILSCLIEMGADPKIVDKEGLTALHSAASAEQVDILLAGGADIEARDRQGRTPLLSEYTSSRAKERLLERGADITARTKSGQTLLHVIHPHQIKPRLWNALKRNLDLNIADNQGLTPLMTGDAPLSKFGADVHRCANDGQTALHFAKSQQQAQDLLDCGASLEALDRTGHTPLLRIAAKEDNSALLQYFVDRGANCKAKNREGATALHIAAQTRGGLDANALLLFKSGLKQEPDETGRLPLHIAAASTFPKDLKRMLSLDPNSINKKDKEGRTPLHHLGTGRQDQKGLGMIILTQDLEACARILLEAGADILSRDKLGRTPLQALAELEDVTPLKLALEKAVDPKDRDTAAKAVKDGGRMFSAYRCLKPDTPLTLEALEDFVANAKPCTQPTDPGFNLLQNATQDEVRALATQFLEQPQRAGVLLRKICGLQTFSLEYWKSRSKSDWAPFVKEGLKALGPLPTSPSPVLKDIHQALEKVGNDPVASITAEELLGRCTSDQIRCFGRTLVIEQADQTLLCIKLQDENESLRDLANECAVLNVLRSHKKELGLRSDLPEPVGLYKVKDLFKILHAKEMQGVEDLKRRVSGTLKNECRAYVYKSPKTYFQYLSNTDIDDEQFRAAWNNVLHDLAILRRHHIGYSVAGLFHDGVGNPLEHQRRYFPLYSLVNSDLSPEGVIDAWIRSLKYPNVAVSGLRDFGDIIFYDDLDNPKNRVRAAYLRHGRREGPGLTPFIEANLRVETLVVFELMLAHRQLVRYLNNPTSDPLSPDNVANVSEQLLEAAVNNMMHETGSQESQVRVLLSEAIDWQLYARQLLFWSNPALYVPYLKRGEIPHWVLPSNTFQVMNAEKIKYQGEFMKEDLGYSYCPRNGSDLGQNNGEYPIKEGIKMRYLAALFAAAKSVDTEAEAR